MSEEIKIVIIEDENSAVNRLKKELNKLTHITFQIQSTFPSIKESKLWFENNDDADLIFMDVQLADGLSFELFKQVEIKQPIIFTTAYDEYALKAFKVNSVDYLLKPIDPEDLKNAIEKYINQRNNNAKEEYLNQLLNLASEFKKEKYRSSFLVSFKQKMLLIDINEVAYLYIKEKAVFICKKDGKSYALDFFLDEIEKQLDPSLFYRANRQYLVAKSSIQEIEPYFNGRLILKIHPKPDAQVIISKEKSSDFKRWADY